MENVIDRALRSMGWLALVCACSSRGSTTGGVELEVVRGPDGSVCGRGVAMIQTDYISTNVALFDLDGNLKSSSFIHSGSADVLLNAPLGGDVVFPTRPRDNQVVLIDRYPTSVLSFVDVSTAQVTAQLGVRTGFDANPRDFLQIDDRRALVSRYELNPNPGEAAYDLGDDLLVIDVRDWTILESIDLGGSKQERTRPSALLGLGDQILVSLSRLDSSFEEAEDAQILVLDRLDLSEIQRWTIHGMRVCEGLSLSPDESELVVSCSGLVNESASSEPDGSGLVVLDVAAPDWQEIHREAASDWRLGPLGFSVDHARHDVVLLTTFGAIEGEDAGRPDRLVAYDVGARRYDVVLEGPAFALGSPLCTTSCGRCYATNAEESLLHVLDVSDGISTASVRVDTGVALPPRHLQLF